YPAFLVADLFSRLRRSVDRFLQRRKQRGVPQGEFPPGLNDAGLLKGEYGIGDSSRAYCKSIRESNLPAVFINIHSRNHRNLDRSFDHDSKTNPYSVNLMAFSFDYARRFSRDMGTRFFKDRYNIGLWYWELEKFP